MPELPEVETMRRYLNATSLHRRISLVQIDKSILGRITGPRLKQRLKDASITSTQRYGKLLFCTLSSGSNLVIHFGMTGYLHYYQSQDERPPYTKLLLTFENGYKLSYSSMRKLGRIDWCADIGQYLDELKLGPDALGADLTSYRFLKVMASRKGPIKSILMNQRVVAGIGNLYADEILFQTGIHPVTPVLKLSEIKLRYILHTTRRVLKKSIEVEADFSLLPRSWLLPVRKGDTCPRDGAVLQRIKTAGRTSVFCSRHQILS